MTSNTAAIHQTEHSAPSPAHLRRSLKPLDLAVYGLIFMIPIAPVAYYGSQVQGAHGMVSLAYIIGMIAMLFTGLSYCSMARRYPYAGSVYNYVQQGTGSSSIGFISGWGIVLDYFLLPTMTNLVGTAYISQLIPAVPEPVWLLLFTAISVTVSVLGVKLLSRLSKAFLVLQFILIAWFVVATIIALANGSIRLTSISFYNPADFSIGNVLSATGLVVLCFVGFDAISTLAEESDAPRQSVPKGIIWSILLAGVLFVVLAFFAGCVQPDYMKLNPDTAFVDVMGMVGGGPLTTYASIVMVIAFPLAAGQECVTSVSRILYAMGRDGIMPKRFGSLSRKYQTPAFAIVVVGILTAILSLLTTIDAIGNLVSFGALIGFMLLNLTVIWHLFIKSDDKDVKSVFAHLISPIIGFAVCLWIFTGLGVSALTVGAVWLIVGIVILAIRTKGFKKKLDVDLGQYFS